MSGRTPVQTGGFASMLGFTIASADGNHVIGHLNITPRLHQLHGTLHQGVYSSVVETAASIGASLWLGCGDLIGVSNHTHYLRATSDGLLLVDARPISREATLQLWKVVVLDETGRLCAMGKVELTQRARHEL
jgi:1,4-dihydroxy-2-naphthoyl-CoA hydrolase